MKQTDEWKPLALETYRAARRVFDKPGAHAYEVKDTYKRSLDADGNPVYHDDPAAVCWDLLGAICLSYKGGDSRQTLLEIEREIKLMTGRWLSWYQIELDRGQEGVVELLDRLIARLEKETAK